MNNIERLDVHPRIISALKKSKNQSDLEILFSILLSIVRNLILKSRGLKIELYEQLFIRIFLKVNFISFPRSRKTILISPGLYEEEVALFLQCKAREVSTLIRRDHEKNNSLLRLRISCILILYFHSFIHLLVLFNRSVS